MRKYPAIFWTRGTIINHATRIYSYENAFGETITAYGGPIFSLKVRGHPIFGKHVKYWSITPE